METLPIHFLRVKHRDLSLFSDIYTLSNSRGSSSVLGALLALGVLRGAGPSSGSLWSHL